MGYHRYLHVLFKFAITSMIRGGKAKSIDIRGGSTVAELWVKTKCKKKDWFLQKKLLLECIRN